VKLCLVGGLLLLGCGAAQPTPLQAAEAACDIALASVIEQGMCDDYEHLDQCPVYILEQAQCWALLQAAERSQGQ
jgi:hypothetical protein